MLNIAIRQASAADCPAIARAIAISSGGYAQIGWKEWQRDYPGLDIVETGARMYARDEEPFTWRNCVIAGAGETVGVMLSYGIDVGHVSAEPRLCDGAEIDVYWPARMEAPDSWYICAMTVFEPWRGKGVGSRLLEHAFSQARQRRYPRLSLIAFEQNEGSVRLYQRNGFGIVERRRIVPHPDLQDTGEALLMVAPVQA
jgi:ribosomal protein S18 acetylase RimI-like enzyme